MRKRLGLDFGAPYRGVLDMLERDRRQQLEFRQLTSSAWALSISETARSIVDRNAGLLDDQRRLSTDEESAELQGRLIDLIVGFVQQLGPRTIAELHEMGLFQWSGWLAGILGLLLAIAALHPDQSPEEKAAFAALNQKVEALQQETRRYHEAEARADEAYVAGLPRAELSRDATLRREPRREGAVVLKAPEGMVLAIERRQGRWRLVMYRDPLIGQLARAWVYASAVSPLAPPVDADAR